MIIYFDENGMASTSPPTMAVYAPDDMDPLDAIEQLELMDFKRDLKPIGPIDLHFTLYHTTGDGLREWGKS